MSIAKNFVDFGEWGINSTEFSSSTSSPLYTGILAFFFLIFGKHLIIPFLFNIILAFIIIYLLNKILTKVDLKESYKTLLMILLIFVAPFMPLIYTGLEHNLHIILQLLLLTIGSRFIAENQKLDWKLPLISALIISTRYEAVFPVFFICLILLFQKRIKSSVIIGVIGLLPITLYGLYSINQGWFFFPNSVVLKGSLPEAHYESIINWLDKIFIKLTLPHIMILWVIGLLILYKQRIQNISDYRFYINVIFLLNLIFHICFAGMGWFYRYEAYLIVSAFLVFIINYEFIGLQHLKNRYLRFFLLFMILIFPFVNRSKSIDKVYRATKNIHDQQYQMARFLNRYYYSEKIAANDIGYINMITDIKCYDLLGLGSKEVGKAKKKGEFDTEWINNLCLRENIKIGVLHDSWFEEIGGFPDTWTKIATLKVFNNYICGDDEVHFYAIDQNEILDLKNNLKDFNSTLPNDIELTIYNN